MACQPGEAVVDLIFVSGLLALWALALGLVRLCERLQAR